MSHYSLIKLKIKNPNMQLLKNVIQQICGELHATIVTSIKDYYGNTRTDFLIGFKSAELPNGVGIKVENGEVQIVGDFFLAKIKEGYLQNLISQSYTALALNTSLKQMGYMVQQQKVKDKMVVMASAYG